MRDDLDAKLDRIANRIQARRSEVRAHLGLRPDLLDLAEACKATFAARLVYLKVGEYVTGEIPEWDRWPKVLASEIGEPWEIKHEPRRR